MSLLKPSFLTTRDHEYSIIAEAQEKEFKTNYMQVIEFLEEEINNSLKEIKERKTQAAINKTQIKEITQDLKIEKESIKKTLINEVLLKS